jgi:hypothetical protein
MRHCCVSGGVQGDAVASDRDTHGRQACIVPANPAERLGSRNS